MSDKPLQEMNDSEIMKELGRRTQRAITSWPSAAELKVVLAQLSEVGAHDIAAKLTHHARMIRELSECARVVAGIPEDPRVN